jgi:hypothetical protein
LRVILVGTIVPEHQELADSLRLGQVVSFVGRVPFSESERYAASADVLLVIDAPSKNSLFLPSKLIDYLPLRKPILGLTPPEGASADVIRSLGYRVVRPDDETAIRSVITELLNEHSAGALRASPQHDAVSASYDIRETARSFAEILSACAA